MSENEARRRPQRPQRWISPNSWKISSQLWQGHHLPVPVIPPSLPFASIAHVSLRRLTLCHQAVHHALDELDLVLDAEVDKVGVDKHAVRGAEVCVVREEETAVSYVMGLLAHEEDTWVLVGQRDHNTATHCAAAFFSSSSFSFAAFLAALSTLSLLSVSSKGGRMSSQTRVRRLDHPLDGGKLACLLCFSLLGQNGNQGLQTHHCACYSVE